MSARASIERAFEAYIVADYRYAAMLFRQSAEHARESKDNPLWFESMVWVAEALYQMGDLRGALTALVMARAQEPCSIDFEHWLSRKLRFKILLASTPLRSELESTLDELEQYFQSGSFSEHDLYVSRAELAMARGLYGDALMYCERAAAIFSSSKPGAAKAGFCHMASMCCVFLSRFSAAENWISAIYDKEEWDRGFNRVIARYQASCELTLARARGANQEDLEHRLRKLDDLCIGSDDLDLRNKLWGERVRIGLLNQGSGDPIRWSHPSRVALRELSLREMNCHVMFERSLLILDYRLACLRFLIGAKPVDDQFVKAPPVLDELFVVDESDFKYRLRQASAALRRVRDRAFKLDALLDCKWRTETVDARAVWIKAIAYRASTSG